MMKESVGSLRTYFLIIGVLGLINGGSAFSTGAASGGVPLLFAILNILSGVLMIATATQLPRLIGPKPNLVKAVIVARFAIALGVVSYSAMHGNKAVLAVIVIWAVIGYYLFKSVDKLSAKAREAAV